MAYYTEERQGQTPTVRGAGTGSLVVDWDQQPGGMQQASQILGTILATVEQEEAKKEKKQKEKFDMYRVLRDAGYDTKSAYEAMMRGDLPATPPGETMKEKKEKLELTKTEEDIKKTKADTKLSEEKAAAYARGDIGKRQATAEKMNAAQLQREIKRMSDPLENPDWDSKETKSYVTFLNQRLQELAKYRTGEGQAPPPPVAAVASGGKIKVRRKADGKVGSVSPQYFDPNKYEKI